MRGIFKVFMTILVFLIALIAAGLAWLFALGPLKDVDLNQHVAPAWPAALDTFGDDPPITDAAGWRRRRALLLDAFQRHVYGPMPAAIAPVVTQRAPIAAADAGGVEGVEQWRVELTPAGAYHLVIVTPPGEGPHPVILVENFCGNQAAFPGRPAAIAGPMGYVQSVCTNASMDPIATTMFGKNINGPPYALLRERGYALAMFYAGDVVPDRAEDAGAALSRFAPAETGAVAAWAWMYSRTLDALAGDPRFDLSRATVWGHSRNGKAALLAAASDQRFAAVVALQAGRGGDALTRHRAGESVAEAMNTYSHWFTPRFAEYASVDPPVDQHQLLALAAPRPLLLLHARRDFWADPVGARAALEGAKPVYSLIGAPAPEAIMRGGWHGIYPSDWRATLDFLDARLPASHASSTMQSGGFLNDNRR